MPSVHQIKLSGDLVSWCSIGSRPCKPRRSRVDVPVAVGSIELQNRPHVIFKYDVDVETALDESCCLKQIIVVLCPRRFFRVILRPRESARFVYCGKFLDYIIVEAMKHDKHDTFSGQSSQC